MIDDVLTHEELHARFDLDDGGYLPNGRVEGATDADWLALLHSLRTARWPVESGVRGDRPTPKRIKDLLADAEEEAVALRIEPGSGVQVNIFPDWGLDTIWFDFDVRQMTTDVEIEGLRAFLRLLGRCVHKPVVLSHEGADDLVFAQYQPADDSFTWKIPRDSR